jgi:hypothetical protein
MSVIFSRPKKLENKDTILYEIRMLRYTASKLEEHKWNDPTDAWVYLESFLIHYRNLIEFLGKTNNVQGTDLHITTFQTQLSVAPPADVIAIHTSGQALWQKYEVVPDKISRYLQHCTTYRVDPKDWKIDEMMKEIEPLLDKVERALLPYPTELDQIPKVIITTMLNASTMSGTPPKVILLPSDGKPETT